MSWLGRLCACLVNPLGDQKAPRDTGERKLPERPSQPLPAVPRAGASRRRKGRRRASKATLRAKRVWWKKALVSERRIVPVGSSSSSASSDPDADADVRLPVDKQRLLEDDVNELRHQGQLTDYEDAAAEQADGESEASPTVDPFTSADLLLRRLGETGILDNVRVSVGVHPLAALNPCRLALCAAAPLYARCGAELYYVGSQAPGGESKGLSFVGHCPSEKDVARVFEQTVGAQRAGCGASAPDLVSIVNHLADGCRDIPLAERRHHVALLLVPGCDLGDSSSATAASLRSCLELPLTFVCIGTGKGPFASLEELDAQPNFRFVRLDVSGQRVRSACARGDPVLERLFLEIFMHLPSDYRSTVHTRRP